MATVQKAGALNVEGSRAALSAMTDGSPWALVGRDAHTLGPLT